MALFYDILTFVIWLTITTIFNWVPLNFYMVVVGLLHVLNGIEILTALRRFLFIRLFPFTLFGDFDSLMVSLVFVRGHGYVKTIVEKLINVAGRDVDEAGDQLSLCWTDDWHRNGTGACRGNGASNVIITESWQPTIQDSSAQTLSRKSSTADEPLLNDDLKALEDTIRMRQARLTALAHLKKEKAMECSAKKLEIKYLESENFKMKTVIEDKTPDWVTASRRLNDHETDYDYVQMLNTDLREKVEEISSMVLEAGAPPMYPYQIFINTYKSDYETNPRPIYLPTRGLKPLQIINEKRPSKLQRFFKSMGSCFRFEADD